MAILLIQSKISTVVSLAQDPPQLLHHLSKHNLLHPSPHIIEHLRLLILQKPPPILLLPQLHSQHGDQSFLLNLPNTLLIDHLGLLIKMHPTINHRQFQYPAICLLEA